MTGPLSTRDAQVIQWSLRCLAHLLKILWRPVSANLVEVYDQLEGLFSTARPDFIRHLGAETVAFLLRKTKEKEGLLERILQPTPRPTDPQAVAKLLFEAIKAVNEQFNTHARVLWPLYLEKLAVKSESGILFNIFQFCGEHATSEHLQPLVQETFNKMIEYSEAGEEVAVNHLLKCLKIQVLLKGGKLIKVPEQFFDFFESKTLGSDEFVELVAALLTAPKLHLPMPRVDSLLSSLLASTSCPLPRRLALVTQFTHHPLFNSCFLKPYLVLVQQELASSPLLLPHLASLLRSLAPPCLLGSQLLSWRPHSLDLQVVREVRSLPRDQLFTNVILEAIDASRPTEVVVDALTCAASIRPMDVKEVLAKVSVLTSESQDPAILPAAIVTAVHLGGVEVFGSVIKEQTVLEVFLKSPTTKTSIQSLDFLLSSVELPCDSVTDTVRDQV